MGIDIIRNGILNNIPKYIGSPNELIINIRIGDIFLNGIEHHYSKSSLCFYQKILLIYNNNP